TGGARKREISSRLWPSGVRIMAISTRMPRNPVTPSAHSPSIGARPSGSRPSSVKNAMAASMSSTTMPTLSIRLTVMISPWRLTKSLSGAPCPLERKEASRPLQRTIGLHAIEGPLDLRLRQAKPGTSVVHHVEHDHGGPVRGDVTIELDRLMEGHARHDGAPQPRHLGGVPSVGVRRLLEDPLVNRAVEQARPEIDEVGELPRGPVGIRVQPADVRSELVRRGDAE